MIQDLLVTIFVPVYNGDKYLNETLSSIKNQSYTHIEVLLVDDSSTDGSKNILNEFANNDNRFKVFTKKNGGMVSASWNFIMSEIKGDYVFYSSQDDIFSLDLIEKMVKKQKDTNADSIVPDMEFYFENKKNNKKIIGLNGNRAVVLSGKEACTASLDWTIHGFPLTKTSLLRNEFFFEDAFDTDEFISRKLFLNSNKVVFCEGMFYYRQDNLDAITKTFTVKNFYTLNTLFRLFCLVKDNNFDKSLIINTQYSILKRYIQLSSRFQFYNFETEIDKEKVIFYLSDFKKNRLESSFYFLTLGYAILSMRLRYLLLVIVFKIPVLFDLMISINARRRKQYYNLKSI